jgi:CRP-like cAMP-binding protein
MSAAEDGHIRDAVAGAETRPPGSELVAEGEALDRARIVLSGWAARVRMLSDGRRQILSFLLPGDAFGIAARPCGFAPCTISALTAVTIAELPGLSSAIAGPDVSQGLGAIAWCILRHEEMFLQNQLVRVGRQTAYERTAHLLLELYHRLKAVSFTQGNGYVLPLTQEMLADALGLSVVHTNRTLQQLRRDKLIETHGSAISILQPETLARVADFREPALPGPKS